MVLLRNLRDFVGRAAVVLVFFLLALTPSLAFAACTSPSGVAGQVVYNADSHVHQYCNDTNWVAMAVVAGDGGAGASPPTSGLIGYWKLDDGAGTNANDDAGTNDGTLTNGPTWVTGKISGAVDFDGNNDSVRIADSALWTPDPAANYTWAMWINSQDLTSQWKAFWWQGLDASNYLYFATANLSGDPQWGTVSNGLVVAWSSGGVRSGETSFNNVLTTNAWHHIAITYQGSLAVGDRFSVFVNGVDQSSGRNFSSGSPATFNPDTTWIGGNSEWVSENFDGLMDDVRIYNRVLSASEISQLYSYGQLGGAGGCLAPAGVSGAITFNRDTALLQYCDGDEWRAMGTCGSGSAFEGMIGHWKLDEGSGATAADSASGGSNGTLTGGPVWASGTDGNAINFDGTNDYVDIPLTSALDLQGNTVTLSAWINADVTTGTRRIVSMPTSETAGTEKYALLINANQLQFWTRGGVVDTSLSTAFTTTGSWVHVAGVYDGATMALYVNGALMNSVAKTGNLPATTNGTLQIGRYGPTFGQYFDGRIDDVRVYARALSAEEIRRLARTYTLDSGKVAHWPFDESAGTTAKDLVGVSNGTTVNSPVWTPAGGRVGGTLDFDGADDRVDAGSDATLDNLSALTIVGWIRPDTLGEGPSLGRIIGKTTGNSTTGGWTLNLDTTNRLTFDVDYATTDLRRRSANNTIALNQWQHVAVTWTGSSTATNAKIYINGVETTYATTTNASGARAGDGAQNIAIGNPPALTDRSFDGRIDDLRIYNRALSAAEIAALHDAAVSGNACTVGGQMLYDDTLDVMKYCDGSRWRGFGNCTGDVLGAIAYWKLDETSGTTASDSSGNALNGTLINGPVWTTGKIGGALDFDATDDYVTIPSYAPLNNLDSLSVCGWFYIKSGPGAWRLLVSKFNGSNGWNLYVSSGDSSYGFQHRSGDYAQPGGKTFDEWQHFCGTAGDGFVKVYRNGVLGGSAPITGSLFDDSAVPVTIGSDSTGWNLSRGPADDIRIYDRVLSAEEIRNLYVRGR